MTAGDGRSRTPSRASAAHGGVITGHDSFWRQHDRGLLSGHLMFVCLELFLGLMAIAVAHRAGNGWQFLRTYLPAMALNLAVGWNLVYRRERMARQRQAWLAVVWVGRLVAYIGASIVWDFEPVVAAPDPAVTLLRFLLQGPVCIALVPLGQRLHLALGLPLQAVGVAFMLNLTSPRVVPVMERAAGPLVVDVCTHLEEAVQLVVALALPGAVLPQPAPRQVCAVQAAARILIFVNWALGFVLPMSAVIGLEAWARRQHALRCVARPAAGERDSEQRRRAYQRLSADGGLITSLVYVAATPAVLAVLWRLVTWLVV